MDPITSGIAIAALKQPLEALWRGLTKVALDAQKKWKIDEIEAKLATRVCELDRVRTILSGDAPVPLSSFYYPSRVRSSSTGTLKNCVRTIDDIEPVGPILLSGTLGQGKSVFMRYLALMEALKGERIPVLIELRGLDAKTTLQSLLLSSLSTIGFSNIDSETLDHLLHQGKLVIFADGFDEVRREWILALRADISTLMSRHPATRWIISSRPGSLSAHLNALPSLHYYSLVPLKEEDHEPFLTKLQIEPEKRNAILNEIKKSSMDIKGVLRTPLMLTLLVATFNQSNGLPTTLHDFYLLLFNVVMWRHDGLKPMYQRERATTLSTQEMQDVFESFCYFSKDFGVSLSDEQFSKCARNSAKYTQKIFSSEGLRADLTENICLMMPDGLKTAFIHKGIQEFFAATFVKNCTVPHFIESFYKRVGTGAKLSTWQQEINFLEKIDRFRYLQHFRLPAIESSLEALGYVPGQHGSPSKANIRKFISNLAPTVVQVTNEGKSKIIGLLPTDSPLYNVVTANVCSHFFPSNVSMGNDEMESIKTTASGTTHLEVIRLSTFLKEIDDTVIEGVREACAALARERAKHEKTLSGREEDLTQLLLDSVSD
ncbi:NACHT domain-containing protein [Achromobacter aloeverae]